MTDDQLDMFGVRPKQKLAHTRGRATAPDVCCPDLPDDKAMLIAHQFSHRRTPFTTATVAEIAGCDMRHAEAACMAAVDAEWCYVIGAIPGRGRHYTGRLK